MKNAKKYKNIFAFLTLVLIGAVLFSGCSSGAGIGNNAYMEADYNYAYESPERVVKEFEAHSADEIAFTSLSDNNSSSTLPAERKIIKDANITMEVEDVEKSFENILEILEDYGGYEASRDMRVNYDKIPTVTAVLKIPADKLDAFMADLNEVGDIIVSSISSSDITDQYYDSQTRLTTLEKTLDKYYEFLDNAKSVKEQLEITNYINDLTSEIEQIKGSLKRWDSLVAYSTVTLEIYKIYEAPVEERTIEWSSLSFDDMTWLISSGFVTTCSVIVNVLQRIIIIIISGLPVLIPLAAVLFFGIRHQRRKKKQPPQSKANDKPVTPEKPE